MGKFSPRAAAPVVPPPPPLPEPPPDKTDREIQADAAEQRKRQQLTAGRGSTILTRGPGVAEDPNIGTKTLLG